MRCTIPEWDISIEDKKQHIKNAIKEGINQALTERLARAKCDLRVRDIKPEDFQLTSWATPSDGMWIDCQLPGDIVLVIIKALQLSAKPNITRLEFFKGFGSRFRIGSHELECCYAGLPILETLQCALLDPDSRRVLDRLAGRDEASLHSGIGSRMEAWFSEPYIYGSNSIISVKVKGRGSKGDYIALIGYAIEPFQCSII